MHEIADFSMNGVPFTNEFRGFMWWLAEKREFSLVSRVPNEYRKKTREWGKGLKGRLLRVNGGHTEWVDCQIGKEFHQEQKLRTWVAGLVKVSCMERPGTDIQSENHRFRVRSAIYKFVPVHQRPALFQSSTLAAPSTGGWFCFKHSPPSCLLQIEWAPINFADDFEPMMSPFGLI